MNIKDKRVMHAYLNRVRRCTTVRTAEEQDELIRQLEDHIHESMADSPGATAAQIIDRMDPPESFGDSEESGPQQVLGRLTLGQISLVTMIVGITIAPILMAISALIRGSVGSVANIVVPLGLLFIVAALAMGIVARRESTGKASIMGCAIYLALLSVLVPVNRAGSTNPLPVESYGTIETEPSAVSQSDD